MTDPQHPAGAAPRTAVVTLPGSIDVSSARRIGGELGSVLASGVTTVIADMTATTFCDSAGARILVAACEQAPANNIEMLLVMPSTFVLRALTLMGLDGVPVYLTLDGALAHGDPSPDQTGRH
jgi:anti-sigma B factor antagonist